MKNTTTKTHETASLAFALVLLLRLMGVLLYIGLVRPLVALQYTIVRAQNALMDQGIAALAIRVFVREAEPKR